MENNQLSRAKRKETDSLSKILWWFSSSVPEAIEHSESDRYRAKIIGLGVMFTWIYASIAWTYLWSTNIESPLIYVSLGLFIGFGILTIDRMLIASISKFRRNIIAIALRVILALFLGAFIAQPLILWMFNQDIGTEIAILQEEQVMEKQAKLENLYAGEKSQIQSMINKINQTKSNSLEALNQAESEYLAEIDGTGGSMRYGIAGVAAQKEIALNRSKEVYNTNLAGWNNTLDSLNGRFTAINNDINTQRANFRETDLNEGFLIRVEALMSLFKKDDTGALKKRYYLILAILIIFELIPIISKLFLQTGSYDDKIKLRDDMEREVAFASHNHELEIKQKFNSLSKESDLGLIKNLFTDLDDIRAKKVRARMDQWQKENGLSSFDSLWNELKADLLSKQEI